MMSSRAPRWTPLLRSAPCGTATACSDGCGASWCRVADDPVAPLARVGGRGARVSPVAARGVRLDPTNPHLPGGIGLGDPSPPAGGGGRYGQSVYLRFL